MQTEQIRMPYQRQESLSAEHYDPTLLAAISKYATIGISFFFYALALLRHENELMGIEMSVGILA